MEEKKKKKIASVGNRIVTEPKNITSVENKCIIWKSAVSSWMM
jgi:hypothetical protein